METIKFDLVHYNGFGDVTEIISKYEQSPKFDDFIKIRAVLPFCPCSDPGPDNKGQVNNNQYNKLRIDCRDNIDEYMAENDLDSFEAVPEEERYIELYIKSNNIFHLASCYKDGDKDYMIVNSKTIYFNSYEDYNNFYNNKEFIVEFYIGVFNDNPKLKENNRVRLFIVKDKIMTLAISDELLLYIPQLYKDNYIDYEVID